jgi:hypothetical protein
MRNSQKVGKMPQIYYDMVYEAAELALASAEAKGNAKYMPRKLEGYEESGLAEFAASINGSTDNVIGVLEGSTKEQAEAEIENQLGQLLAYLDINLDATIKGDYTAPTFSSDTTAKVDAKANLGYESADVSFDVILKAGYTVEVIADKNIYSTRHNSSTCKRICNRYNRS